MFKTMLTDEMSQHKAYFKNIWTRQVPSRLGDRMNLSQCVI